MPSPALQRFVSPALPGPPSPSRRPLRRAAVVCALAAWALVGHAQEGRHGGDGGRGLGGRPGGGIERAPAAAAPAERMSPPRPGGVRGGPAEFGAPHMRFDNRFQDGRFAAGRPPGVHVGDGHYYPARGFVSAALPPGALNIGWRGGRYYYQGGVWFRPYGSRFTVIAPPFGIVLPVLPLAYATLWVGGAPYYYANDVYYTPAPGGYRVVAPPPGVDAAQAAPDDGDGRAPQAAAAVLPDPIVYPRNGQTAEQTEADRQQCNRWATTQPGAVADAGVFQRAVAACLDGRGYTVR